MKPALADLRVLWATRQTSGFPWPFSFGGYRGWKLARFALTGHPWYSAVPLRRQVAAIPLRPWRYAKMVRAIAKTRNQPYSHAANDTVA